MSDISKIKNTSIIEYSDISDELMNEMIENTITDFDENDLVTGTVVKIERDEVLLDIGFKSEGVIPARELSIRKEADPSELVELGERVEALVLIKEDKDGRLILSKKRAEYERAWIDIEQKFNAGENVIGEVIEVVKGGLILDIGLRGFLPASLVDLRRVKDLESFTGEQIEARIIEMDRNRNNVVLSRRVVLEEGRKNERSEILEKLTKGMRLKGAVSSIVEFGAFVDLGGIDGLVHISELSWNHVSHPSEVVKVGDDVEVEVLEVDLKRERISLGLKQTQEDPWRSLVRNFPIGAILEGKVTKLVSFGTFVELGDGIEGLVHISEMATKHIVSPAQVAHVGDIVNVKVMDVDPERRRISLSMKSAAETLGIEIEVAEADATMIKAKPTKAELAAAKHSTDKAGNEEDAALAKDAIAADDNEAAELGVDGADDAEVTVAAADDVIEVVIDVNEATEVEAEVVAVADDEAGTAQAPIEDIIVPADDEVSDSNLAEEITEAEEVVAQVSEETVEVAEAAEVIEDDTEVAENVVAAADDAVADFESETETE